MPTDTQTCRTCGETKPIEKFDIRADTGRRRTQCMDCRRAMQNARNSRLRPARTAVPARLTTTTQLLRCTRCGVLKSPSEFPPVRRGEPKLQTWCRVCFAAVNAMNYVAYYERERERIAKRHRDHRDDIKRRLVEYLLQHRCVDCGVSDIVVLEFDHVRDKVADVATYANGGRSWDLIAAEIAKCEVRCANCHRRKTVERRGARSATASASMLPTSSRLDAILQLSLDAALGMRACRVCHITKPLYEFPFRSLSTQTRKWICKACQRQVSRTWYGKNRERHATTARRAQRLAQERGMAFVLAYLKEHPCVDCGESDVRVLEFDHLRDKVAEVSVLVRSGWSIDTITAEIAKCEVRCANCHRRMTCARIGSYRIIATAG